MVLTDLHTHSKYSIDGSCEIEEMVAEAVKKGVAELAITEHFDFTVAGLDPVYMNGRAERAEEMQRVRELFAGKIKLLHGIEIGHPYLHPHLTRQIIDAEQFDVIIGSVHDAPIGKDVYLKSYDSKKDCDDTFEFYFKEMERLFETPDFDIMGHIDFPLRVMCKYFDKPDLSQYRELMLPVLRSAAQNGVSFEINTRGTYSWQNAPGPQKWVLETFKAYGGERVSLGSDAHLSQNVGSGLEQGIELAKSAGFDYITSFEKRKPVFYKI